MKQTKQMELVLQGVRAIACHPSADELYARLKADHPQLSLATVYRHLNRFAEQGMIRRLTIPGGGDRFDGDLSPHYHFLCEDCGRVFDIPSEAIPSLEGEVGGLSGMQVTGYQLMIYGRCESCRSVSSKEFEKRLIV